MFHVRSPVFLVLSYQNFKEILALVDFKLDEEILKLIIIFPFFSLP